MDDARKERSTILLTLLDRFSSSSKILVRQRRFSCAVVGMLSLGLFALIGSVATLRATLLRDMPWHDIDHMYSVLPSVNGVPTPATRGEAVVVQESLKDAKVALTWYSLFTDSVTSPGLARESRIAIVDTNFFSMLGISTPGFLKANWSNGPKAFVSSRFRAGLQSESRASSESIRIGNTLFDIVGTIPEESAFPLGTEVWVMAGPTGGDAAASQTVSLLARVPASLTEQQTKSLLTSRYAQSLATFSNDRITLNVNPFVNQARPQLTRQLRVIITGVLGFFVILCTNIAITVQLRVRKEKRNRAIRTALGAPISSLHLSAAIESLILVAVSVTIAAVVWYTASAAVFRFAHIDSSAFAGASPISVSAFLALLAFALTVLFAAGPVAANHRMTNTDSIKAGTSRDDRISRVGRYGLISLQVSCVGAFALTGTVVGKSYFELASVDFGFDASNLYFATANFKRTEYKEPSAVRKAALDFQRALLDRVGSEAALWSATYPRSLAGRDEAPLQIVGRVLPAHDPTVIPILAINVTPSFFETFRYATIQGRLFNTSDDEAGEPVAIVNRTAAKALWPGKNPVGELVRMGGAASPFPWMRVIGVVSDQQPVHELAMEWANEGRLHPLIYRPFSQAIPGSLVQPLNNLGFSIAIRHQNQSVRPDIGVRKLMESTFSGETFQYSGDLQAYLDRTGSLTAARHESLMFGVFGTIGLLLALFGVLSSVDEIVERRQREVAVRRALGSPSRAVVFVVTKMLMLACTIGLAVGGLAFTIGSGPLQSWYLGRTTRSAAAIEPLSLLTLAVAISLLLVLLLTVFARTYRKTASPISTLLRSD